MKRLLRRGLNELAGVLCLLLVFALATGLLGSLIDLIRPPADGERFVVRITGNTHGMLAILGGVVVTVVVHRAVLRSQWRKPRA